MANIVFEKTTTVSTSIEKVYQWHLQPIAFEMLTPPWEKVKVISPLASMQVGQRMSLQMWPPPGLFPVKWNAKIVKVIPNEVFVDEQTRGPFAYWRHTHAFEHRDVNSCTIIDCIEFRLPFSFLSHALMGTWVTKQLKQTFDYRHRIYTHLFSQNQSCPLEHLQK